MNKSNKIVYSFACLTLLVALVIAGVSMTNENFAQSVLQGSRSVGNGTGFLNRNISGTVNLSFQLGIPDNLSITNVSYMWILQSNTSLYHAAPGNFTFDQNVTLNNNTLNQTTWNTSFDTTVLPDGMYNVSVFVFNITNGDGQAGAAGGVGLLNLTFMINITIDNTKPKLNITSPVSSPLASTVISASNNIANLTFNVTVNDTFLTGTGIKDVIYQFHNGTYFNRSATKMDGGTSASGNATQNLTQTKWGISVNRSSFSDLNPLTVTIYAIDYAGNVNNTESFFLNVDTTLPTISLAKDSDASTSDKLVIDITTSADVSTCTTNQGTISGSGNSWTASSSGLAGDSTYSFTIRCIDEVDNSLSKTESFTTDSASGGSGGSASASNVGGSRSSGRATAGVVEDEPVEESVEDVTPPSVPTDVAAEPAPSAGADEAARDFPTEETAKGGSVVGWVIGAIVLLGLVAAYFFWSKKN